MGSASWAVTAAGWFAITAGAAVTLLGVLLVGAMFSRGGIPVGGAGLFAVLSLGAGPLLIASGITIVISGFKLMGGYGWARTAIDIFAWIALCVSVGWLIYSASQVRHIHSYHVIQGAMFFLATGVPAIVMIVMLRSQAIERAMMR